MSDVFIQVTAWHYNLILTLSRQYPLLSPLTQTGADRWPQLPSLPTVAFVLLKVGSLGFLCNSIKFWPYYVKCFEMMFVFSVSCKYNETENFNLIIMKQILWAQKKQLLFPSPSLTLAHMCFQQGFTADHTDQVCSFSHKLEYAEMFWLTEPLIPAIQIYQKLRRQTNWVAFRVLVRLWLKLKNDK